MGNPVAPLTTIDMAKAVILGQHLRTLTDREFLRRYEVKKHLVEDALEELQALISLDGDAAAVGHDPRQLEVQKSVVVKFITALLLRVKVE